jgi:hypothetical protein
LEASISIGRPWQAVVDECDIMSDKNFILNRHTFANECVTRDLAAVADLRPFLDLNERADRYVVSEFAAVEVGKAKNANTTSQLHPRSDEPKPIMRLTHAQTVSVI